jgi:RNA polymerase sigma-70 factor (ECF subfamily)
VRDPHLAEDVISETALEIVRSWNKYDRSRPFPQWARGVARHIALKNLRKRNREPLLFDPEVLESVGKYIDSMGDEARLEERKRVLHECMQKLPLVNQQLIRLRYFENRRYEEIAGLLKRNVPALYMAFTRIHEVLLKCVQKNVEFA